jgi:hypothetical protein
MNARTMTFVPVAVNKAVYCTYGMLEPVIRSEWRQCSGYQVENAPPGDESMTDELNRRLRFRLSDLKTLPSGNFRSVTMEIVNHVAARKQVLTLGLMPKTDGIQDICTAMYPTHQVRGIGFRWSECSRPRLCMKLQRRNARCEMRT